MSKYHGFFAQNIDRDCSWRKKKNARLRTSQLPRAPPLVDFENFERILHVRAILRFRWLVSSYIFPFLIFLTKKRITDKGILVCRPNRLHVPKNVIKTRCCKMRRSCVASSSFLVVLQEFIDSRVSSFRFRKKRILWYSAQTIYRGEQQVIRWYLFQQ